MMLGDIPVCVIIIRGVFEDGKYYPQDLLHECFYEHEENINPPDGFIEEKDGDKYLSIAFTEKNKQVLERYSEVWNGIKDCIEKINDSELGEYEKYYMKIKFNSDVDIPLNKQLYFPTITVIIRNIFEKDGKYYPQTNVCMKCKNGVVSKY